MARKTKKQREHANKSNTLTPGLLHDRTEQTTIESKARMLAALRESGGIVTNAAKLANIGRTAHYDWLNTDTDYAKAVSDVGEISMDECESTLFNLMRTSEHDPTKLNAAKTILQARGKSRGYGSENRDVKLSGELNTSAKVEFIARLPDNGRGPAPTS